MKNILTIALLLPVLGYAVQPAKTFTLQSTELSPKWTFSVEYYLNESNGCRQLWISDYHNPTNRASLYDYDRSATVCFSPNEKWLVVNDYSGSSEAAPVLFWRARGMSYTRVKDVDLDSIAWEAAARNQGFSASEVFDHRYSEVLCWLGESGKLLIHAWGYYGGVRSLDDWFCIYDVTNRKVSFDLSSVNVGAYRLLNAKGTRKPNHVPEDTARKLADPQH